MIGARETILQALFEALQRIPNVDLCERNRTNRIDDDTPRAIVLHDGDLIGETDRKHSVTHGRRPDFPMTITPTIWGYVEGSSETVGTKINQLFDQVTTTLFTDRQLITVVANYDGGIGIDGAAFPTPSKSTSPAIGVFMLEVSISFIFDPTT